jgi:hypothetical protein
MCADPWQEKIHGFLDPADDKPEYFAAIGRLITAFNGIDVILNMILRHQLGAETKIGRAIIGTMRTGDMLASIKRLAKVTGMDSERLAELEHFIRISTDLRTSETISLIKSGLSEAMKCRFLTLMYRAICTRQILKFIR